MNILHLRYAVEVAATGSINKAAENLYMGQPNLSRAIRELEESLGITIFHRTPKGIHITQDGIEFLHQAKSILDQVEKMENYYSAEEKPTVNFHICAPYEDCFLNAFFDFVNKNENLGKVSYTNTDLKTAFKSVCEHKCDLGIIMFEKQYEKAVIGMAEGHELKYEKKGEIECRVVFNENHPLAVKENLEFTDLLPYTEITSSFSDNFFDYSRNIKGQISVNDTKTKIEMLNNIQGTFMFIRSDIEIGDYKTLVSKPLNDTGKWTYAVIYPKDRKLCGKANEFLRTI